MKKYITVFASFCCMLCLGGVYAWSIIASELIKHYHFTAAQTQLVFGTLIAVFPAAMIGVGKLARYCSPRYLGYISGIVFMLGYGVAAFSRGNFLLILCGIGLLAGIGTGFGYWVSLTIPVQWFPQKKGLIAGIAAGGFGLGAVLLTTVSKHFLTSNQDLFDMLLFIGIVYGGIIVLSSNFLYRPLSTIERVSTAVVHFFRSKLFYLLFLGIFCGTFAGLLIIGSLTLIGEQQFVSSQVLLLSISLLSMANFAGRIIWGFLSDHIGASITIFLTLTLQAIGILLIDFIPISDMSFILLSICIGFGFGGNFVLFAKETAQFFGIEKLGVIYPYVLLGYAIAGIAGPLCGGLLFDMTGSYSYAVYAASMMSMIGGLLFLYNHCNTPKDRT